MASNENLENIRISIADLKDAESLKTLVNDALSNGIPVKKIVEEGVRKGLNEVGRRYEGGEYFLAELLYAASLVDDAFTILKPHLTQDQHKERGIIVLGTVRGDIHDIGKNIFKMLAEASGFEVHDLGVDVDSKDFLKKVKEVRAPILGLSALLTTTIQEMKNVILELESAGIRDEVKVLLGGNAVTKEFADEIHADYAALDSVEGVEICKKWTGKQ